MSMDLSHQLTVENLWEDFESARYEDSPALVNAAILHAKHLGYDWVAEKMQKALKLSVN